MTATFAYVSTGRGAVFHIAHANGKGSTLCGRRWQTALGPVAARGGPVCVGCDRVASRFHWSAA